MNQSDVVIGKCYSFTLLDTWSDKNAIYRVKGFSSPDIVMAIDESKNIFATWFQDYGLSIYEFESYISSTTIIYVCTKIITEDPLEEGDEQYYIPITLIDFQNSLKYLESKTITYTVTVDPRIFDSEYDENEFLTKSKNDLVSSINSSDEFMADSLSIQASSVDSICLSTLIEDRQAKKDIILESKRKSIQSQNAKMESSERRLYMESISAQEAKAAYIAKQNSLSNVILQAQESLAKYKSQINILNGVKDQIINCIAALMSQTPEIFDNVSGLNEGYTATDVYNAMSNLVS